MVEEERGDRIKLRGILNFIPKVDLKEKDILECPEAECILNHISKKMKKKKDYKVLFSGETGSGKSYGGLRLLELWYLKNFNEKFPINHIVSNLAEAVLRTKDVKRKGEGLLIEEISTSAGSRDSNTKQNKLWNKFLDTCRIKQMVLVMNAPHITFCDKHIRMCLDSWVNCSLIDFKKNIVQGRPLWLQTSPHKSEPYKHHYINENGEEIDTIYFKKPSKYITKPYDESKDDFSEELYNEIYMKMTKDRQDKLKLLGIKFLSKREREAYELYLKGYTSGEAIKKMGLSNKRVFDKYIRTAKEKLSSPEYKHQLELLKENAQKKRTKRNGGRN